MVLGVRCDVDIFKLTASAQSIYREVNASLNNSMYFSDGWGIFLTVTVLCCIGANSQQTTDIWSRFFKIIFNRRCEFRI